jgi:predicted DNA-binding protein (UPF0251 family)
MARPCKTRLVGEPPAQVVFKPAGVPARELEWIELAVDEYEALRLVDGEGLEQEAAAELMGVSRPTVSRILARGRGKLARMLSTGGALVIGGGVVCPRGGRAQNRGQGCHGRGRGQGRGRGRG